MDGEGLQATFLSGKSKIHSSVWGTYSAILNPKGQGRYEFISLVSCTRVLKTIKTHVN